MNRKSFFDGKVVIRTLALVDQPANRLDVQARLVSPSGELAVLTDGEIAIQHLGYVEFRHGLPRGNHFHKLRHEHFYMIAGETELHVEEISTGRSERILLHAGDLAIIHPGFAHAFLPMTSGHGLEFAAEPFDATDVYRYALVRVPGGAG